MAAVLLVLGPTAGVALSRGWGRRPWRTLQLLAYVAAAAFAFALLFVVGTSPAALCLLGLIAALALGAAATVRRYIASGGSLRRVVPPSLALVPLFVLFFRMPPVTYSLTLTALPAFVEYALYAPEILVGGVALAAAVLVASRSRRDTNAGKGYPRDAVSRQGGSP